jgi:hypothetical protein
MGRCIFELFYELVEVLGVPFPDFILPICNGAICSHHPIAVSHSAIWDLNG